MTARDGSAWELRAWRTDDAEVEAVRQAGADPTTQLWLIDLDTPYTAESARQFLTAATAQAATGDAVSMAVAPVAGGATTATGAAMATVAVVAAGARAVLRWRRCACSG